MHRILVVGDLHLGIAPNNSLKFEELFESQKRFFQECLLPTLIEYEIETIIFTGDIYDQKRRVDSKICQYVENLFENELKNYKCIVIQGNHDTYYREDLSITSLSNIWSKKNVKVVTKICSEKIGDKNFLFVPWLTKDLVDDFVDNVPKVSGKFDYLIGHFETIGFPLEVGNISIGGLDPAILYDNFKNTISGHFHTQTYKSVNGNSIHYVGTPYQLTFGDSGEEKGITILDLDDNSRTFVENKFSSKFIKLKSRSDISNYKTLKNCFVEFEYPEGTSDEDLFATEKEVYALEAINYKAYLKVSNKLTELIEDKSEEEIKIFDSMSIAIHSENMLAMTKVFLDSEPYDDPETVLEEINDIRATISG